MESISNLLDTLDVSDLTPARWCQVFFVGNAGFILMLQALPDNMRRALMDYGARRATSRQSSVKKGNAEAPKEGFFDVLTSYGQVPHSWFMHFYITSVAWSIFWGWQFVSKGSVMRALAVRQHHAAGNEPSSEVELTATLVAWLLMGSQGARRLFECLFVLKPGSSGMWFVHWVLGLAYYTTLGISVWIQGSGSSHNGYWRGLISLLSW